MGYIIILLFRLEIHQTTAQANDSIYIGGYVSRIEDTEKGVTCYTSGPSGISCLQLR